MLVGCPANCLQPWRQNDNGRDQGQVFFTPNHVWAMPPFYAQQMAARNYQPWLVQTDVSNSDTLDVAATRSADGRTLVLSVVNTGSAAQTASVSLAGFVGLPLAVRVWILAADLNAVNPLDDPETVHPQESTWKAARPVFGYTFPAHSYTVLRCFRVRFGRDKDG